MATAQAPAHLFYMALQEMMKNTADSMMHVYQQVENESEQHVLLTLCGNLYRMEETLLEEIARSGVTRPIEPIKPTEGDYQQQAQAQFKKVLLDSIQPPPDIHYPRVSQCQASH